MFMAAKNRSAINACMNRHLPERTIFMGCCRAFRSIMYVSRRLR